MADEAPRNRSSRDEELRDFVAEVETGAFELAHSLMVPRQPGETRGQHFLPKFLLKRFADDERQIGTVDLTQPDEIRINHVSNTAKIKDYHTIDQPGIGPSNAIEGIRSHVESLAAPALERVATGLLPPSAPDRFAIAMWAAQMYCFSPPIRRQMEAVADQFAKLTLEGTPGTPPSSEYEVVLPQNNQLQMGMEVAQAVTQLLDGMWLTVAKYSTPGLAIGDCPLWLYPPDDLPVGMGVGFTTAVEVRLPIDRETVLVFHRDEQLGDRPLWNIKEQPEALAEVMAETTCRNLYCHPDDLHKYAGLSGVAADRPIIPKLASNPAGDGVGKAPMRTLPRRFSKSQGRSSN